MILTTLDWAIIATCFAVSAAIGIALSRRGGRSLNAYFLTGRSLRWWLAGTSMVLYPTIADKEAGYAMVIRDHLPPGWRGLLLGAFFAASTCRPFRVSSTGAPQTSSTTGIDGSWRASGSERYYVWVSRVTTIALMIVSGIVTFYLDSIRQPWEFVLESGAGIGLVLMLRRYWWRITAWSEISAMAGAAIGYAALRAFTDLVFPFTLLAVVAWTTVCRVVVTMATSPEPDEHLIAFYRRTRPDGPGWAPIARLAGAPSPATLGPLFRQWAAGVALVYASLFALGHALLGSGSTALDICGARRRRDHRAGTQRRARMNQVFPSRPSSATSNFLEDATAVAPAAVVRRGMVDRTETASRTAAADCLPASCHPVASAGAGRRYRGDVVSRPAA